MDSLLASAIGKLTWGKERMVFDWVKAAQLIKEEQPRIAAAGLRFDWEWTGGIIWEDGKPVTNHYTYLASTWAIPELDMDGEIVPCFVMESETTWDENTKWPPEALKIVLGKEEL